MQTTKIETKKNNKKKKKKGGIQIYGNNEAVENNDREKFCVNKVCERSRSMALHCIARDISLRCGDLMDIFGAKRIYRHGYKNKTEQNGTNRDEQWGATAG